MQIGCRAGVIQLKCVFRKQKFPRMHIKFIYELRREPFLHAGTKRQWDNLICLFTF